MTEPTKLPLGGEEEERFKTRDFRLTSLALKNRVSVLVMLAIITLMGILAYIQIPKEAAPEVEMPMVAINTMYPGVSPADMETLVTRVIEEELNNVADLTNLTSTSVEGYSSVIAEFSTDVNMDEALQKVRERVDLARPELPADAEEPMIMEFVMSDFPIMQVNVSGEYSLVQLKEVAEALQEDLEQVPSILEVRLSGGLEREVRVDVDLPKLQFYELGFGDVIAAIASENLTIPGGSIDVGNQTYLVRVDGEFRDTRVIEDIVITTRDDRPIYVRDVASVDFGFQDRTTFARLNGNPVVTLDVVNRSGENILATAEAVNRIIEENRPSFPPTTETAITSDMSRDIVMMVSSLENNIISGLLLVLAILLFFLGARNASIVAFSIPTSMLLSFIVMSMLGISMNMVVLFSLILALGMLVDNSIVVLENIYRFRELGYGRIAAARLATGEVAIPIIASTLTTLAAFAPLMFWPGMVGEFMGYLPLTLIITLTSSLFVALVITPVLAAMFVEVDGAPPQPMTRAAKRTLSAIAVVTLLVIALINPLTSALLAATGVVVYAFHRAVMERAGHAVQRRMLPAIIDWYEVKLRWALEHRKTMLAGTGGIFVLTLVAFAAFSTGIEFFPEDVPPRTVFVSADLAEGTTAEFSNEVIEEVERRLPGVEGMQDTESIVATVRENTGGANFNPFGLSSGPASVAVNFKEFTEREDDVFETIENLETAVSGGIAGAEVTVTIPAQGPPTGLPVNIEIAGDDPEVLRRLGDEAVTLLANSPVAPRLEGLESSMSSGRPELVVEVDRERAALYGLSTQEVGMVIRNAIQGAEAAKFRAGEDEYDITVRLAEPYRQDLTALQDLTIVDEGRQIPLTSVATWRTERGASAITRNDLRRTVTVSAGVQTGENANAVLAEVQQILGDFADQLPAGYTLGYTGMNQEQMEAQEFLMTAFLAALLLIAFILMSQFNSVIKPVIIMTSVIMSTIAVFAGLTIFRMPFILVMTGVGIISLAGVVVNNAIVLIDYIDMLRERDGMDRREALVQAGRTRFRPVILTAVTTVLGLVPLATGMNIDFIGLYTRLEPDLYIGGEQAAWWGNMSTVVIIGLTLATVLTLVLVPVLYSVVDDLGDYFKRVYTHSGDEVGEADEPSVAPRKEARRPRRWKVPVEAFVGTWNRFLRAAED